MVDGFGPGVSEACRLLEGALTADMVETLSRRGARLLTKPLQGLACLPVRLEGWRDPAAGWCWEPEHLLLLGSSLSVVLQGFLAGEQTWELHEHWE